MRFLSQVPQMCYQRIDNVEELLTQLRLIDHLEATYVPVRALPWVNLILEVFEWDHLSTTGRLRSPVPGVASLGLHNVVPEGRRVHKEAGLSVVEFWNSWGSSWGKNGYGTVDRDYLDRHFHEAWIVWNARLGWHAYKEDDIGIEHDRRALRTLWMHENPIRAYRLEGCWPGDAWRVERFSTVALNREILEVIQLQNGYGLRMGWAHLHHREEPEVSEIRELFVMPAFRGQSVGSCLEGLSSESALHVGSREIHLMMQNPDSVIGTQDPPRAKARKFGIRRGYEWRWPLNRPGIYGVASKPVNEAAIRGVRAI
jgi:hypothetical protein